MLKQIILVVLACFAAGAILMFLANVREAREVRIQRWFKYFTYFITVNVVLTCAALGRSWFATLVFAILAAGMWELRNATRYVETGLAFRVWIVSALLFVGVMGAVLVAETALLAFVYLVVAAFDGFSQVTGQFLGKHPLVPIISPRKTVEGLGGGVLAAVAVAVIARGLVDWTAGTAAIAAIVIAACALSGDLSASWLKRRAGLKDYGRVLPGHGGVLDRFDSFIGATGLLSPALFLAASQAGA